MQNNLRQSLLNDDLQEKKDEFKYKTLKESVCTSLVIKSLPSVENLKRSCIKSNLL
jgi:hypothetical protein